MRNTLIDVPEHIHDAIIRYIEDGYEPGDFLKAVICNNLIDACAHADWINRHRIFEIVGWFYNHAPSPCWGSEENYRNWIAMKRRERSAPELDVE